MKLLRFSVVLVILGFTEIPIVFGGICLVRNSARPKEYWFQCFRSHDCLEDVNKAPIDVSRLTFAVSKIPLIRNESFVRVSDDLKELGLDNSGVKEIEDNAFRGLAELEVLTLKGNELRIIKASWFEGLSSLSIVSFKNNNIKHIEDGSFAVLPPYIDFLDISGNQLTCLPSVALAQGKFKVHSLHIKNNPLTWSCHVLLRNWWDDNKLDEERNGRPPHLDTLARLYDFTTFCANKLPTQLQPDEEFLRKCNEETIRQYSPTVQNYTVSQMCEFLKSKPSPIFNCTA